MKIYDMHIHVSFYEGGGEPNPSALIERMEGAGVYGGGVFSVAPQYSDDFDYRFDNVMKWTQGYEGRLFPVMYVHPHEKDIAEKCIKAAGQGIYAYKMICNDYFVRDKKCMELMEAIASTGKPAIFHSGILWSGDSSSMYNRPTEWEHLIDLPSLRFSMGHCSWPWVDECIAVYGKFLNSYAQNPGKSEMFFDTTPGTPPIYRKELWYKMFNIGYDVPHNIMFGSDSVAAEYNKSGWVESWLKRDNEIFDELGVSNKVRKWIFEDNFMRFLGLKEKDFVHRSPVPDDSNTWTLADEAD